MIDRPVRAYLGLGANLGDAEGTLAWAVDALAATPGIRVRAVSSLYATAPWGVADQPEFRNAVVAADVRLEPLDLLSTLKDLERDAGRRAGRRWGPRELDIDILLYGRRRIRLERPADARSLDAGTDPEKAARLLEVPHRDLRARSFVLAPLADLVPGLVPPGWHETVGTRGAVVAATERDDAARRVASWDPVAHRWRTGG